MGLIRRWLGLETRPGEPSPISGNTFDEKVLGCEVPCFVEFYNLWCASCQVMNGLLNELGPEYLNAARLYKLNTDKNPSIPARYGVKSVPTLIVFKGGEPVDRLTGLVPLDILKGWIEKNL